MLVPQLLPKYDAIGAEKLGEAHSAIFKAKFLHNARPFKEAGALLNHAHIHGQLIVLASSASGPELEYYLDLLDARNIVETTISGDDVKQTKPAPDIFSAALAKLDNVQPDEAIVVGDTPYDIEAAAKCGIAAVAVRSGGFSDDVLATAGAVAIYDNVAALLSAYDSSPLSSSSRG